MTPCILVYSYLKKAAASIVRGQDGCLFGPEDECSSILRNVGKYKTYINIRVLMTQKT
jgi:hypothetical protein